MSKKRFELLNDTQWELIEPLLPEPKRRKDKRGCPWASNRACLEVILWVLQTGAAWRFLPDKYPSPATCWRRLKRWEGQDVWLDAWRALLGALDSEGLLQWEEAFLDGSFAPAKKGLRSQRRCAGDAIAQTETISDGSKFQRSFDWTGWITKKSVNVFKVKDR